MVFFYAWGIPAGCRKSLAEVVGMAQSVEQDP